MRLALAFGVLLATATPAFAEPPLSDPASACQPPASDATHNVVIARLQCRLAFLDADRTRVADRATIAEADLALKIAEFDRRGQELLQVRAELDRARDEIAQLKSALYAAGIR